MLEGSGNSCRRWRVEVGGIVQGVGFRPFVYRLATERGLTGAVWNHPRGVSIEVEGPEEALRDFLWTLRHQAPPLAVIEEVVVREQPLRRDPTFCIRPSAEEEEHFTLISPDVATCADCLRELFDPADRRYRYPFINCTNCGPRYTIILDVPYDRPKTTMRVFPMCPACEEEYHDPTDRRFHAQPNACPLCGPRLEWQEGSLRRLGEEALQEAVAALRAGKVVAIKGLGGYHLACDATNEEAVATLRRRKHREDKPFALMARDLEQVGLYAHLSPAEERLLASPRRPIVLLWRKEPPSGVPPIAPSVAPLQPTLGFMLPYTPLHHLLMASLPFPIVLTSGNLSEEPIAYKDEDALRRLAPIADAFLLHNREIHIRCDDSVIRVFRGEEYPLRRSRGYAPQPLPFLPRGPSVLAVGAHLKNTFCLTTAGYAFLSHHIGDLENELAFRAFVEGIRHLERLFDVRPQILACDLHPDYLATQYAHRRAREEGLPLVEVQHHHAHVAACLAERGQEGPAIGVAWDGAGLGPDGTLWGGEFLLATLTDFRRVGWFEPIRLLGGEKAMREPWRTALSLLWPLGEGEAPGLKDFLVRLGEARLSLLRRAWEQGWNAPRTTSVGRLFDGVAALLGLRAQANYEGQAAVELEALSRSSPCREPYPFVLRQAEGGAWEVGLEEWLKALLEDLRRGRPPAEIGRRFHATLTAVLVEMCRRLRETFGVNTVALSGGVFQNMLLLEGAVEGLRAIGFEVLWHHRVPPNDGGLSLGQAAVAAARFSP